MKQSLQLKMGQQLTMTPQLQQAIRLLQLSTLDLQAEIQEALESNPLLEITEAEDTSREDAKQSNQQSEVETETSTPTTRENEATADHLESDGTDSDWSENIPTDLAVDTNWDDIYQASSHTAPAHQKMIVKTLNLTAQ